jgi:hypothetical protein
LNEVVASSARLSDVRKAHAGLLGQGAAPAGVRDMVADSWFRSVAAGVDVEASQPPIALPEDAIGEYRAAHPLAQVFPMLHDVLGRAAVECDSVMAVADDGGRLLWVCGKTTVLRQAESIRFVEGAQWDEDHAGTNAPGTALRLDAPVTISSAEHFVRPVQRWSCAAAPIHDPGSDAILGVIDITGGRAVDAPQTIAMVRAAARMAEAELARLAALRAPAWPAAGPAAPVPEITITGLGRAECVITTGRSTLRLSPRHSEIMVILAACPDGLTGDELAYLLYPAHVTPVTPRAELARLRALLGDRLLGSRPYRLRGEVRSDWAAVAAHLAAGDVAQALARYRGPLLPRSAAPGVVDQRDALARALRAAVLASGRPELMVSWTQSRWGADDLEMWQRQCAALPADSPLRPVAAATAARLDAELAR